jgi:hypothetical protein
LPGDVPRDYGRVERAGAGSREELGRRLERLPAGHPSSPEYAAGDDGDDDGWRAAAERPEWREALARGDVDQVGPGVVDERASRFTPRERQLADYLAGEGRAVVAVHDGGGAMGRRPDATVDGAPTEFKSLDPGASNTTVKGALNSGKGQALRVIVDSRGSGLAAEEAERGLRRFLGSPYGGRLNEIRIIGDGYEMNWNRG